MDLDILILWKIPKNWVCATFQETIRSELAKGWDQNKTRVHCCVVMMAIVYVRYSTSRVSNYILLLLDPVETQRIDELRFRFQSPSGLKISSLGIKSWIGFEKLTSRTKTKGVVQDAFNFWEELTYFVRTATLGEYLK